MAGGRIILFVTSFLCCSHLLRSFDIVNTFAKKSDIEMRQSRKRQLGKRQHLIQAYSQTIDLSAVHFLTNATKGNAGMYCMANYLCTTYVFLNHTIMYSTSAKRQFRRQPDTYRYEITFRCPIHHTCSTLPCNNGSMCVDLTASGTGIECICDDSWKGWYCEGRKSCLDDPCIEGLPGAECLNSTAEGFHSNSPAFTTGIRCEVQMSTDRTTTTRAPSVINTTIVTEVNVSTTNRTAVESGMTTGTKVVIGAAAAGYIVVTGVAAVAVIGRHLGNDSFPDVSIE